MNLASEYARATEYNLATLEELCSLKSSSLRRIERQVGICTKMLQVCQEYEPRIEWEYEVPGALKETAFRVRDLLRTSRKHPDGFMGVWDEYLTSVGVPKIIV